jgi:hypothetical protein
MVRLVSVRREISAASSVRLLIPYSVLENEEICRMKHIQSNSCRLVCLCWGNDNMSNVPVIILSSSKRKNGHCPRNTSPRHNHKWNVFLKFKGKIRQFPPPAATSIDYPSIYLLSHITALMGILKSRFHWIRMLYSISQKRINCNTDSCIGTCHLCLILPLSGLVRNY